MELILNIETIVHLLNYETYNIKYGKKSII